MTQPSLAYRRNREAIWRGEVPEKYLRLLPFIQGRHALEIGAAEGVLALTVARERVTASIVGLELRPERHSDSRALQARWRALGYAVDTCTLLWGDIRGCLNLLDGTDVLIVVRTLYYLRADALSVLNAAHLAKVRRIVLCGNASRQAQSRLEPDTDLGRFNRLASVEGMADLLEGAGYQIHMVVNDGDPIVVGTLS